MIKTQSQWDTEGVDWGGVNVHGMQRNRCDGVHMCGKTQAPDELAVR